MTFLPYVFQEYESLFAMSILFTEEERRGTVEFLRNFAAVRPNAFGEDEPLPFRVTPLSISVYELEGECIDWCLQYLCKRLVMV